MTIAFSEKYGFWTTRYSFEPTCYASVDNDFLSSKAGQGVWIHDDPDVDRNSFYGDAYASEILVSSNQDPSAIKFYKSLSVETNAENISAEVTTNEEYSGKENQAGSVSSFENREGFKYSDMPRDAQNSSSNMFQCPNMYVSFLPPQIAGFGPPGPFYNLLNAADEVVGDFVFANMYVQQPLNAPVGSVVHSAVDGNVVPADMTLYFDGQAPDIELGEIYVYKSSGNYVQLAIKYELDETVTSSPAAYLNQALQDAVGVGVWNVGNATTGSSTTIEDAVESYLALNTTSTLSLQNFNPFRSVAGAQTGEEYKMLGVTLSVLDGDQMRGPYAKVKINILDTTPFELHAINVDYSFSNLDARLTQNA